MEYARIVRTKAALDSVDSFLDKIRTEIESDQREEVLDELLEAANQEILFIRVNLLGTLVLDEPANN